MPSYRIYSTVSWLFFFNFSLSKNAPWLRIGVIHKGSILQVSFTSWVCEAYCTERGQREHILLVFCIALVGEICIVPYNLFIFSMKWNHYTAEFRKKKHKIILHSSITWSVILTLGGGRNKRSNWIRHGQWCLWENSYKDCQMMTLVIRHTAKW
jgi:hypothetical protein